MLLTADFNQQEHALVIHLVRRFLDLQTSQKAFRGCKQLPHQIFGEAWHFLGMQWPQQQGPHLSPLVHLGFLHGQRFWCHWPVDMEGSVTQITQKDFWKLERGWRKDKTEIKPRIKVLEVMAFNIFLSCSSLIWGRFLPFWRSYFSDGVGWNHQPPVIRFIKRSWLVGLSFGVDFFKWAIR